MRLAVIFLEARLEIDFQPNTSQTNIKLGFRTCGRDCKDIPALSSIGTLLTGSRSARLVTGLREHKRLAGLTYRIRTDQFYLRETGYFAVETTKTATLREVLTVITDEFQRLVLGGITTEEVDKIKQSRLNQLSLRLETTGDWLSFHAERDFGKRGSLSEYVAELQGISREDVIRVAQKYFHPEDLMIALSGNVSNELVYSFLNSGNNV